MTEQYSRSTLLLGEEAMTRLSEVRVILFGVGGVGSWCAEGLVRTGVRHLTIVDSDSVSLSNCNRQLMATRPNLGRPKVEALKERLLEICPEATITALQKTYSEESSAEFSLGSYDYIIDAIDSLRDKASLILEACRTNAVLYSAMGAALKLTPAKVKVAEFWKVEGCPLARALRTRFKKAGTFPSRKFLCVYDDEVLPNRGTTDEVDPRKASVNGSLVHITATFGMTLCGLVINDIYSRNT